VREVTYLILDNGLSKHNFARSPAITFAQQTFNLSCNTFFLHNISMMPLDEREIGINSSSHYAAKDCLLELLLFFRFFLEPLDFLSNDCGVSPANASSSIFFNNILFSGVRSAL